MSGRPVHFDRCSFRLEPLSPVHIGSDDVVEPLEYAVTHSGDHSFLAVVDLPRLLQSLTPAERDEFDRISAVSSNPLGIREWIWKIYGTKPDPKPHRIRVQAMPNVAERLGSLLKDTKSADTQVSLFPRDPRRSTPYVPGSSLKGAIRTAIISERVADRKQLLQSAAGQRNGAAQVEAAALNNEAANRPGAPDHYRDPLRQLLFEDLPLSFDATYIEQVSLVRQRDRSERPSRGNEAKIAMFREVLWSEALGTPEIAQGVLRWHRGLWEKRAVPLPIGPAQVVAACNSHYLPRLRAELNTFDCDGPTADLLLEAAAVVEASTTSCLLRLGRHSHFECMTVAGQHTDRKMRFGKSRTYTRPDKDSSGESIGPMPLGWCRLTFE